MNWRAVGVVASLVLIAVALFALHHILANIHPAEVLAKFRATPLPEILLTLLCTAGSYLALTAYDVLGLYHIGQSQPYARAAFASFTSYTFSNNIGLSLITGGSIRYRIYSVIGLSGAEIATLTAFCTLTFGLGTATILGLALLLEPTAVSAVDSLPPAVNRAIGIVVLLGIAGYGAWTGLSGRPLRLKNWILQPPSLLTTALQILIAVLDISFAAGALYALLPTTADITFVAFVGIFVVAMSAGLISHSPGGIGVFEAMMLLLLPGVDQAALLGSLLVFRCVYYLLPLALAALLLAWHEFAQRREKLAPFVMRALDLGQAVAPAVIGIAVFTGGVILLFSGATPAIRGRLDDLRDFVPLPFIEASHFVASLIGLWLLILSRGLFRRLDGAYHLTLVLLGVAIVFSLLKGLDYEEALILGFVCLLLMASRDAFYRRASLFNQPFTGAWIATIAVFVGASVWLGFFSYKHVQYSGALWWDFAYNGDAPRFMRASVAVVGISFGFVAYLLLRPAKPLRQVEPEMAAIKAIVSQSPQVDANLALTGDKRFVVSDNGNAFVMYQVQGRSWVAMRNPVGPESEWRDLLWQFRELCDLHSGWPVFYQVPSDSLPLYLDLGLTLLKLGEEARVDLTGFSLEGSHRKTLRYLDRRATREGATFEIVSADRLPTVMAEMKAVSDEWLSRTQTREKTFSVGRFSADYIGNFDCAVVRREGKIVAFANIWQAPAGRELSVDLMRYGADAPSGVMDFLFVRLMLWGKAQGFAWFDLGMAPLSGLEVHALGAVWSRVGSFVFRHGEHFYNFEGLRAYKEKFDPVWTPTYLAAPGGLALPHVLLDIAALVSGGTEAIFRK